MVILKLGRNDPCPCGSGKKYKKCCAGKSEFIKTVAPTPSECSQLAVLFNAGRYEEMEIRAHSLVEQYPVSGLVWKALGTSLNMHGKDALAAVKKATERRPSMQRRITAWAMP